jgi:choline dehydrogenase-like flavoprotein
VFCGGGSSINAEIYTRGCPEDYDGMGERTELQGLELEGPQNHTL